MAQTHRLLYVGGGRGYGKIALEVANEQIAGKFFCSCPHNTTTDNSLTRPWTVTKNYRRQQNVTWEENNCVEGNACITISKSMW